MFTADPAKRAALASRRITWQPEDAAGLAADLKGKVVMGVVEQVRDGSCLRCYLPETGFMVTVLMAGVASPRVNFQATRSAAAAAAAATSAPAAGSAAAKVAAGTPTTGSTSGQPPFALEAQFFTEMRLLHRDVQLHVGGGDKHGNVIAKVLVPQGDISVELLKAGLARIAAWSLSFTTAGHAAALTGAESGAKASNLKLWSAYTAPKISGAKHFTGTVVEVVSGDTLMVRPDGAAPRRIVLASVRAPRMGGRSGGGDPWAPAAKEWMRKTIIGKPVAVTVDYSRDAPSESANQEPRVHGSVTTTTRKGENLNLGVELVKGGFAELVKHRSDDPRASCYESLLLAEAEAIEKKRGLHSGRKPPTRPVYDLSAGSANEAKEQLPFLQRAGEMAAVVDYVFSGHRFKVTVPKENVTMIFAVSGVKAPMAPRPGEAPAPLPTAGAAAASGSGATSAPPTGGKPSAKAEPFGAEARQFALDSLMQREVTVTVETLDRNGGALGHLWVGKGASTSLWACELLNLGFASVIPAAADRSEHAEQLFAAEEAAKAGRKGVWWNHDPAAEAKAAASAAVQGEGDGTTFVGVTVCDVSSGDSFSAHADSDLDKLAAVEAALQAMKTEHGAQGAPLPSALKKGSMVAALFDEGNGPIWFRARVENSRPVDMATGGSGYEVTFMDYGNGGIINIQQMRPLDNVPALVSTPPMARAFRLAYVRAPAVDTEWGHAAGVALNGLAMDRKLIAKVYSRDAASNQLVAALFDEGSPMSINEHMLKQGLLRLAKRELRAGKARAAKKSHRTGEEGAKAADELEFIALLEGAQESARHSHTAMWRFGDVADSDDEPTRF